MQCEVGQENQRAVVKKSLPLDKIPKRSLEKIGIDVMEYINVNNFE